MPSSDALLSVHDLFAGAGGSSAGLTAAGFNVTTAINHNPVAIASHRQALPDTEHLCVDISQVDPARLDPPDLLWASPECTSYSPARGPAVARARTDRTAAKAAVEYTIASRATGFDLLRWVDAHPGLAAVVAENVLEWASWSLFPTLLDGLRRSGFATRVVHLNAATVGAATSRDRMFLVAWRDGLPAPDLTVHGPAVCDRHGRVDGVQGYRRDRRPGDRRFGALGVHYDLVCPTCRQRCIPVHTPAAAILDDDPGPALTDPDRNLTATTRARVRNALRELAVPARDVAGDVRRLCVLHWSKPPARRRHPADVGGSWWDAADRPLNTITGVDSHWVVTIPNLPAGTDVDEQLLDRLEQQAGYRCLTVDELAAASGFASGHVLEGTDRQRRIQVGMAVPPPVAAWFGRRLRPTVQAARQPTVAAA